MRPSIARFSEMPGPKTYNLWWGDQSGIRQRGMVQYTISPFQSKAAPHWVRNYLFNGYRRLSGEILFWIVPFGALYATISWAKSYDHWQKSKDGMIKLGHVEYPNQQETAHHG